MRVDLKRFLFLGAQGTKEAFFKEAQDYGIIQFIDPKKSSETFLSEKADLIFKAVRVLDRFPSQEQLTDVNLKKRDKIVENIHVLNTLLEETKKKLDEKETKEELLLPFGRFSPDRIEGIEKKGAVVFQFFGLKKGTKKPHLDGLILIEEGESFDAYLYIGKEKVVIQNGVEISKDQSLEGLKREIAQLKSKETALEKSLAELAAYKKFLKECLVFQINEDLLNKAKGFTLEQARGAAFTTIGWVPKNKIRLLEELSKRTNVFISEVSMKEGEVVPTYLENTGWSKVGEDLVEVYDIPSPRDKDPSLWVLVFFSLFFAMIVSDAVYGLIYLSIALFLRWKFPDFKKSYKRMLNLFTLVSSCCVIWGVLSASYLGIPVPLDSPLRKVSLTSWLAEKKAGYHLMKQDDIYEEWVTKIPAVKEAKTGKEFLSLGIKKGEGDSVTPVMLNHFLDNIALELALLVGVIHILLSMSRHVRKNWVLAGWMLFVAGGYVFVAYYFNYTSILNFALGWSKETIGRIGLEMMGVGMGVVILLALIQQGWMGILEVMTVIQIFADNLSYLRLYALGLAGGILSATIFELSSQLPLFIGFLLMFVAHGFNMVLCVMSGVIHGLRLNFLEWYRYSFEGGGKPFRPLKKIETQE